MRENEGRVNKTLILKSPLRLHTCRSNKIQFDHHVTFFIAFDIDGGTVFPDHKFLECSQLIDGQIMTSSTQTNVILYHLQVRHQTEICHIGNENYDYIDYGRWVETHSQIMWTIISLQSDVDDHQNHICDQRNQIQFTASNF